MASHQLIDAYLAQLRHRLPADAVDELADGLAETWHHHLAAARSEDDAARAAVAEFGTTGKVMAAFVTSAPGRRIARTLLATGPLAGICWGASLLTVQAWSWPLPTLARLLFPLTLLTVVAALAGAATARESYRRTRLGALGGIGLIMLDAALVACVIALVPILAWPMVIAIGVSIARIGFTLRTLPAALAR